MPLAKQNLYVDQGATFTETIQLLDDEGLPLNLSGYTGSGKMRKHYTSSNVAANIAVSVFDTTGTLKLDMTANVTGAIASGRYVYDVEIVNVDGTIRALEGIVTVTPQVTR
jgi:hypothetical protein